MNNNEEKKLKPSEEQIWLKHYQPNAKESCDLVPRNMILWDIIEEKIFEYEHIPALEYFKREFSRPEFREMVYSWARIFRSMGVEPGEIVPIYAPFVPGISAILMALNMIGACPNILKLGLSCDIYKEETEDSKIAVIFDSLYNNELYKLFKDDRFKKVIVTSAADYMLSPVKQIVTAKTQFEALKNRSSIPKDKKHIHYDDCLKYQDLFTGNVKAEYKPDRPAFITYSSGTTGGVIKGSVATNETAINQILQAKYAELNYKVGGKCFTNLPPTAATSLHCLFIFALYSGMTIEFNPIFNSKKFYSQLMDSKPQVALATGSFWKDFFAETVKDKNKDKKLDFFDMPIVGGEGLTKEDLMKMNEILKSKGSKVPLASGYGLTELFSVMSVQKPDAKLTDDTSDKPVISVGIPFPGMKVGVFDENGNELDYNQRGELYVSTKSRMLGYYKNQELTDKTFKDEWLKTGDIAELDKDGQIYIYGRKVNSINTDKGIVYLFDIENSIISLSNNNIKYCIVNKINLANDDKAIVAHVVFKNDFTGNKEDVLNYINEQIKLLIPEDLSMVGYKIHDRFESSPTTGKIDYNGIKSDYSNYINPNSGNIVYFDFITDDDQLKIKEYSDNKTK